MSHNYYKDLCNELKYDLKRKKRDYEDLEDKFKREETESKRLKNENNDLWKLYYGLQQELQSAYERNSKLQVEKMTVEGLYEREKHELEKLRSETMANAQSAATLKEALCTMQSEKIALQHKFNELMVENKKLKDKERETEPKLREVDELKRKIADFDQNMAAVHAALAEQKSGLKDAALRKDQVETYRRYNALLRQESEQKVRRLQQWPQLVRALQCMERRLTDAERAHAAQQDAASVLRRCVRDTLPTFASQCGELRASVVAIRMALKDIASPPPADDDLNGTLARRLALHFLAPDRFAAPDLAAQSQLSVSSDSLTTCDETFDDDAKHTTTLTMTSTVDADESSSPMSSLDVTVTAVVDDCCEVDDDEASVAIAADSDVQPLDETAGDSAPSTEAAAVSDPSDAAAEDALATS